jgi:hypothetical protein
VGASMVSTVGAPLPKMIDLLFGGLRRTPYFAQLSCFRQAMNYANEELLKHLKVQNSTRLL